ncbi:MAG: hypothetical protein KC621_15960 [Myxococcales bacterium]|nr:hypothetical protein [Myxococcales bacterium]
MWLLTTAALAAPPNYRPTRSTEHCQMFLGPAMDNGVVPMHAECTWPGVTLEKADALFSSWASHDEIFSSIVSSEVERMDGGVAYVRQVHRAKGISDREALLKMQKTQVDGGLRFGWTLEPSEARDSGHVMVAFDTGYWEFRDGPDGLVVVDHLEYDPGGSVPGFLVRWFQTSGLETVLSELETWMTTH